MNSAQLAGKWKQMRRMKQMKQMKGSIKERWGKLTDQDIDQGYRRHRREA